MAISLKFNNITNASNFVTFTDIPNLVTVTNSEIGGTIAGLKILISGSWSSASHTDPWFITINGETITGVDDFANAINKNFFISSSNSSTAASIAKALRNCPSLASSFVISSVDNQVWLKGRAKGQFTWDVTTNATAYTTTSPTGGTVSDELIGGSVDVNLLDSQNNYITTLTKNYYQSGLSFDITPLITTLAERGKTVSFNMEVAATKNDGTYSILGNITGNTITQGYLVNQGYKYIDLGTLGFCVAQNYSRGTSQGAENNTKLYVYGDTIPFSWYSKTLNNVTMKITYYSSARVQFHEATQALSDSENGWLHNDTVNLDSTNKNSAYYIGLQPYNGNTALTDYPIIYDVIKPLKATEYYQRVYWRNSYGGVSYFDFTAAKTDARDVDITTYQKNIYDFYTQPRNELDMIYDNKVKYSTTLKSHIIEKDGTYLFNDLLQSPEVWIIENGQEYGIILDSLQVDEDNRNNLFTATIKYHFSQEPSLI